MPAFCDHTMNPRHLRHRYRCERCDMDIPPEEIFCDECAREVMDEQLNEED